MNKKKILTEYNQKIQQLTKYNKFYYNYSNPIVEDIEYDNLKKEILLLEKKHNFLKSENSPSKLVGYKPSKNFKKVLHRIPMLSLANAFDEVDLSNFEKRIRNYLDKKDDLKIEYSAEPKIDGISASSSLLNPE